MPLMLLSVSTAWSAVVAPNVANWVIVPCSWHSCHCMLINCTWCKEVLVVSDYTELMTWLIDRDSVPLMQWARYLVSWLCTALDVTILTAKSAVAALNVTDWMIVQCNWHSCHRWITAHDASGWWLYQTTDMADWSWLSAFDAVRCYQHSWLHDWAMPLMQLSTSTAKGAVMAPNVTDWMKLT